ncbi:LA_2272 family surface repeat-containing protein [Chryseobacterium tongliaoense]|uniref:LA_2272 family surface repeat-containing protein n=1 Tax=Chryseobacterium tongliaoense TaxID=3240933 RepID=UPI0035152A84
MKTMFFLIVSLFTANILYAQDSLRVSDMKTKLVAFTPLKNNIKEVDGIAIGLGDTFDTDKNHAQKINGINLEPNPLGILIWMFFDPSKKSGTEKEPHLIVNGLSLSSGGHGTGISQNGINASLYNYGHTMKGISVAGLTTYINKGNGIMVSGLGVYAKELNGLSISAFNDADQLKGLQVGIYNKTGTMKGVQIGLLNRSDKMKGFQIGFWNRNGKRSLPFINF